ncbi:MAG TPA: hypothetical protein VN823_19460 [Stellaceae bacterium]|nr:hypothetical protein [Stellaceae bacterium]
MSTDPEQPKANNETKSGAQKYNCWPHVRALMCCCARNLYRLGCWFRCAWTPANLPHYLTAVFTLGLAIFAYYAWTEAVHGTQALQGQLKVLREEQRPWVSFGVNVTPLSVGGCCDEDEDDEKHEDC